MTARRRSPGKAHYAADIRVPGMLYAKILRPPAHGATLKSVDTSAAKAVAGAQVIQDGDLIAVLHQFPDVAEVALGKIKADWDTPAATFDDKTVYDHLQSVAPQPRTLAHGGDLDEGKKNSAKQFDSTYLNAYVAHSPMEPHAALCQIEGDKATVWASTQNPFGARDSDCRRDWVSGGESPRHHAVCRRRIWRQDQQPGSGRGRAAGQDSPASRCR